MMVMMVLLRTLLLLLSCSVPNALLPVMPFAKARALQVVNKLNNIRLFSTVPVPVTEPPMIPDPASPVPPLRVNQPSWTVLRRTRNTICSRFCI